jgi:predicted nucleotidyltransferase
MGLFDHLNDDAKQRNLRFVVIGGLAVNLYGHSRDTADLDLLVLSEARGEWLKYFLALGYTIYHDGGAFIQLAPPEKGAWPVDLMLVNSHTFTLIMMAAVEMDIYGHRMLVPSLEHLIALKVHALKHTHVDRFMKDFTDIENLIRANNLDVRSENIRQLFLKYGSVELYEKIIRACEAG